MLRNHILLALGVIAVSLALVSPALAQDDAPRVDPDSPAGTEYQLPIDRAREQAGGSGSTGSTGDGRTPLFGQGVDPETSGVNPETPGSSSKPRSSASSPDQPAKPADEQPELGRSTPEAVRAQAPAPAGSGGGLIAIGAGAAGVLLVGGLAGLLWRRRSSPGS